MIELLEAAEEELLAQRLLVVRSMLTDLGGPEPAPEIRSVLERISPDAADALRCARAAASSSSGARAGGLHQHHQRQER